MKQKKRIKRAIPIHESSALTERRITIVLVIVGLWILVIGYRLVSIQVGGYDRLHDRAQHQQQFSVEVSPTRGIIYDRNRTPLAQSAEVKSLYAYPAEIEDLHRFAATMAATLGVDRDALLKRLASTQGLAVVKRKLDDGELKAVQALPLKGIHLIDEMKRFYVNDGIGSQIIGYVDTDEHGLGGIELKYENLIRGNAGKLQTSVDARRIAYDHSLEGSSPGADVYLTIDARIQDRTERALAEAVQKKGAHGGTIVVLRPSTGEILALASYPGPTPGMTRAVDDERLKNSAIETAFEPGSIFKIVAYSAAIEEGKLRPTDRINCGNGEIRLGNRVVHDGHGGVMTATEALTKSSNVAAIQIAEMLGPEKFCRYAGLFGFGRRTGVELPGESAGMFHEVGKWDSDSLGSMPIGYEVGVTALQAAAAFGTIANGGTWVRPYIVRQIASVSGNVLESHNAESHQVVSRDTATTLTAMLENVVLHGTGKQARMRDYQAAGKTGTARKLDTDTGKYSKSKYRSTFVGFAPADQPEIVCVVSLDEPRGSYTGGDVAAPVFRQLVPDILQALGVGAVDDAPPMVADNHSYEPSLHPTKESAPASSQLAIELADFQPDAAGDAINRDGSRTVVVPNLIGKGLREALMACHHGGLKLKAIGDGLVTEQEPVAGSRVANGATCLVDMNRDVHWKEKAAVQTTARGSRRKPSTG